MAWYSIGMPSRPAGTGDPAMRWHLITFVLLAWPAYADEIPLRDLATRHSLEIGTAFSPAGTDDALYLRLIGEHFSLAVPEWGLYMTNLQPSPGTWNFQRVDEISRLAAERGMTVRGHTLIWGLPLTRANPFGGWTPTPDWVHAGDLTRDQAIAVMTDHIDTVMTRYKGRIREWVVVNEALGKTEVDGMKLNPNIWLELIGPDYVTLALRHARKVDPDAILMINDYGVDYTGEDEVRGGGRRVDDYYDLVMRLLDDGAPIDAVGFQFHLKVGRDRPTVAAIVDNLARYRKLGVSTHITELDVRIPKPVTDEKLREQARVFATVFRAAVETSGIDEVVMWGFTDRYSWITAGETFPDDTAGVIMDEGLQPRPAFQAIRTELSRDVRK